MRTFPNLIKIGLRAVDILQSEVSANDLAGAALINDLIAARDLGCDGAIVGRALYENRFTLEEALSAEGAA